MSLTVHFQTKSYADEFVARCRGKLTHILGVGMCLRYPGVETLYRTYLPDPEAHALVDKGKDGANQWIDRFASVYKEHPDAIFISSNEYLLTNQDRVDRFNAFHVEYIQRMSWLGHRVACGQFNTGWPHLRKYPQDPPPYPESIAPVLAALWAHEGILTLHEYWPGAVTPDGNILTDPTGNIYRYRDIRAALLSAGITNLPPFFVSELGIDAQTNVEPNDFGHKGWREFVTWSSYFGMLQEYSREMDKDSYMLGASIFTVGGGWDTFQINRDQAMALADFIGSDTPPPPPPPPPERAKGLDVSEFSGEVNWRLVKADGYLFAGIRVSGTDGTRTKMRKDLLFENHYAGAGSEGILRLAYHGLHPNFPGQALLFAESLGGRPVEMGWCSDLEIMELTDAKISAHLNAMDQRISDSYGIPLKKHTKVYSSPNFVSKHDGYWGVGRDLWIAHWTYDLGYGPIIPAPWNTHVVWQWSNEGTEVPGTKKRVCLDVFNGTKEELYDKYGSPTNGGNGDEMVEVVDRYGKPLGITWEEVQARYGLRMVVATPPEGATVWRLSKIIHDSTPECNLRLYCRDENGAPLSKITVMMGMHPDVAKLLPDNMAPRFSLGQQGQPIDPLTNQPYPNIAWKDSDNSQNWTNADGYVQRSLGSGSNTSPPRPIYQWAWVANGEEVEYTDWVYGIGGMWVDDKGEHQMWWPEFKRVTEGDEPTPPPPLPGSFSVKGTITLDLVIGAVE